MVFTLKYHDLITLLDKYSPKSGLYTWIKQMRKIHLHGVIVISLCGSHKAAN